MKTDTYLQMFERGRLEPEEIMAMERRYSEVRLPTALDYFAIYAAILALCFFSWFAGALIGYREGVRSASATQVEVAK
jgi:hypothetical protein